MQADPLLPRRLGIAFRRKVLCQPGIGVAHAALPRLVAEEARHHAVLHHAADAGHGSLILPQHQVAAGCAGDIQHRPGACDAAAHHAGMGVNEADCHGDAGGQSKPFRHVCQQFSCLAADGEHVTRQLVPHHGGQAGVKGREVVFRGVTAMFAVQRLIAGRGSAARLAAAQLPDKPVAGLYPGIRRLIDIRRFLQRLPELGHRPLRVHPSPASE